MEDTRAPSQKKGDRERNRPLQRSPFQICQSTQPIQTKATLRTQNGAATIQAAVVMFFASSLNIRLI